MTTRNREDYLISILRLTEGQSAIKTTELSTFMNISPASVTEMVKILSNEGLVEYEKYKGVKLTESGLHVARQVRKKHHVMEHFLMDILNLDHDAAHEEACKMEHAISDESAVKMCKMFGIPVDDDCKSCKNPCDACLGKTNDSSKALVSLTPGEHGMISHLKSDDPDVVKKLISLGFVPGREVTMDSKISDKGPRVIGLGNSTVALDFGMASSIFVDVSS